MSRYCCLDISTAPLAGCEQWLEPVSAPAHYKDPAKIAAYVAEKNADRLDGAALDLDLAWITGIGMKWGEDRETVMVNRSEDEERDGLKELAGFLSSFRGSVCGYNLKAFDAPMLMRRARYLGVTFPSISVDRYRSAGTVDLMQLLSHDEKDRRRSLRFYCRRLGWTDCVKPLTGAEEAQVPQSGRWADLEASLRADVIATYRLACWLGVIQAVKEPIL